MLSGFAVDTTQAQLNEIFQQYGEIVRLDVVENRGYGFVVFKDPAVAKHLLDSRETHPVILGDDEVDVSQV